MGTQFLSFDRAPELGFYTSQCLARNRTVTAARGIWMIESYESGVDDAIATGIFARDRLIQSFDSIWDAGVNHLVNGLSDGLVFWPPISASYPIADAAVDLAGKGLTTQLHLTDNSITATGRHFLQYFSVDDTNGNELYRINDRLWAAWLYYTKTGFSGVRRTAYAQARVGVSLRESFIEASFYPPEEVMEQQRLDWHYRWDMIPTESPNGPPRPTHTPMLELVSDLEVVSIRRISGKEDILLVPFEQEVEYSVVTMLFHEKDPQMPENVRDAIGLPLT